MRLSLSLVRVQAAHTQSTTSEIQRRIQLLRDRRLGIVASRGADERPQDLRPSRPPRVRQF